jgi:hypothetical protein
MTATRTLLSTPLVFLFMLAALPADAQQLAPLAARVSDAVPVDQRTTPAVAVATGRDTLPTPRREISPVGTIIGGVAGGVLGTFVGVLAGAGISEGCKGEMCQMGPVILGAVVGEAVGLATGAHVGSRSGSHGHVVVSAFTSVGIVIAGAFLGAGLNGAGAGGLGMIMVPVTPALQLAAALAIESH